MSTVERDSDGAWRVVDNGRVLASGFRTNAEAWRWFDRNDGREVAMENTRRLVRYHFGNKMDDAAHD